MVSTFSNFTLDSRCQRSSYTEIQYLNATERQILTCTAVIIIVLGLVCNIGAIYSILTLKLHKKSHSIKLILFLFALDLGVCLIAMPLHMAALMADHTCGVIFTVEFCAQTFGHLSAYTTGIIGYDRFLRMKYLNEYSRIATPRRIVTAVFIAVLLSLAHGAAYATGVLFDWYNTASTVGSAIDGVVFIFMIIPYLLLVRVIKKHRRSSTHQRLFEQADHSVNKIAFRIVIAVVCLYTPYVIMTMIRQSVVMDHPLKRHPVFCMTLMVCDHLLYTNSFVNSMIFVSINTACKQELVALVTRKAWWRPVIAERGTDVEFNGEGIRILNTGQ